MHSRQATSTQTILLMMLLSLCLTACGNDESTSQNIGGITIEIDSDIAVSVYIPPELEKDLEVVSVTGRKPGVNNWVEAAITLRNNSASEQRLVVAGDWQDDSARGFGGFSSVLLIPPGQTASFEAGSQSRQITKFSVLVKSTTESADQHVGSTLANLPPEVEGHGVAYTATPTLDEVPAWELRGVANGQAFTGKTIFFTPYFKAWKLEIHDRDIDPLLGVAIARLETPDVQTIYIDFPGEPFSGAVFEREMSYGGGYFQIKNTVESKGTTSWNTEIAWAIEITDWQRHPWRESDGLFQQGGTASGKLYICFKGSEANIKSSWIAGAFNDVPIVYYGDPGLDAPQPGKNSKK